MSPLRARTTWWNVIRIEAILVVHLALLGVAEDVISLLDLFELLFGRFVAGIQVGVILSSQLAIGLADLVVFGSFGYTQKLVVIPLACGRHKLYGARRTRMGTPRELLLLVFYVDELRVDHVLFWLL